MERPNFLSAALEQVFVQELLRTPNDAHGAACRALARDDRYLGIDVTGLGLNIAQYYEANPELKNSFTELLEGTDLADVPNKAVIALEILSMARTAKNSASAADKDFALRAYRLYAELTGFIEKGGANVNVNFDNRTLVNKVMVIPPGLSLDDWTKQAAIQQSKLIEDASANPSKA